MPFVLFRVARSRNPLLRVVFGLFAVAIFGAILLFGLFAAIALALIGAVYWLIRQMSQQRQTPIGPGSTGPRASVPAGVLEGEFVVVREEGSRQQR
ncbi:MAG: hypothetical protein ABI411_15035 [Tahibacter sp.]